MMVQQTAMASMLSAKRNLVKEMSRLVFLVFVYAFLVRISTPLTDFMLAAITGEITGEFCEKIFHGSNFGRLGFLSWTPTVAGWLSYGCTRMLL